MRRLIYILCCAILLFASCEVYEKKEDTAKEERLIKDTVVLYNSLLADGYRKLSMTALVQAATEERATKAYYHMAALGEARVKMDAKIRDFKFLELKLPSQYTAEVMTEEIWDYSYVNVDTGEQVYDNKITYKNRYALTKKTGKWLVYDITVEESHEEKPEKFKALDPSFRRGVIGEDKGK
jgi:hypothetical protein